MAEHIEDGGPAFPLAGNGDNRATASGMTLRDYFAARAMQAIIGTSRPSLDSDDLDLLSGEVMPGHRKSNFELTLLWAPKSAYAIADAMLAARKQTTT